MNGKHISLSFTAAVDKNNSISNIEKMGYLMGFLKDDALTVVKGLLITNKNYGVALKMLEERFGNPQLLIHKHMTTFLSLDTISSIFDLKNLRKVYDKVETQICNLENLDKSYHSLLVPVLMSKLPDELKLLISRQFGKNIWGTTEIMKLFRNKLKAREKINAEYNLEEKPYSDSILHSSSSDSKKCYKDGFKKNKSRENFKQTFEKNQRDESKQLLCIFCQRNHKSILWDIITKPEVRKNILKAEKRCFKCLKQGHLVSDCRSNFKCFKCDGNHHIAICTFKHTKKEDTDGRGNQFYKTANNYASSSFQVFKNDYILLQTARADVFSPDER